MNAEKPFDRDTTPGPASLSAGRNESDPPPTPPRRGVSRRAFLGGLTTAGVAGGIAGVPGCTVFPFPPAGGNACKLGPLSLASRAHHAFMIRMHAARTQRDLPQPDHVCNGDETLYPNRIGSFSKGLPHNALGEVDPDAYDSLLAALDSADPAMYEQIILGSPPGARDDLQKLVNPQAGSAFDLQGADSHHLPQPAAPAFASAEEASEIVENYWMALLRDVPFARYDTSPLAAAAAADLSAMSDFRGPKSGGQVTPATLFRGPTPGDLTGPFISQFLWRPAPFGSQFVEQRMRTHLAGLDFMTDYDEWLAIQNGALPAAVEQFEPQRRYIINGRDIGQWVHVDVLFQAYFNALLILLTPPGPDLMSGGIGCPFDENNPYNASDTQVGFGTFGPPHIAALMCEVATRALKAVWYQKWFVHRRLRPEEFAGRIHNHMAAAAQYPIHEDALNSDGLASIVSTYGTYLLPMEFPEGCPKHPAYGAGHATVAGACVTILKAFFDGSYVIPNPMVPDPNDPTALIPYAGPDLTVGGELNKLASNVAFGRNFAGVHWRTDGTESLKLGELVAISILADQHRTYREDFAGFTFTRFDGSTITV